MSMDSMGRKRYLLALLVAVAEAGVIFGVDGLLRGSTTSALSGFAIALAFSAAGYGTSMHTRAYAKSMFPDARPPTSWVVTFVGVGLLSLVVGALLVLDAPDGGIAHAVWRALGGIWFLAISSALAIGCYHLWREVPRR
jgi:hypothetical protein